MSVEGWLSIVFVEAAVIGLLGMAFLLRGATTCVMRETIQQLRRDLSDAENEAGEEMFRRRQAEAALRGYLDVSRADDEENED